jgi:hypothetical protein
MADEKPDYGRIAYEAYVEAVGGKSVHGEALPTWKVLSDTKPDVAQAWTEAGWAAGRASLRAFADLIDRGPTFPLKPSIISTMAREETGDA